MCVYPYGEFELVSAEITGLAEGIHSPWRFLSALDAGAGGFLEILTQANIVKGKYWGKNTSLGWRCAKYDFSQESLLSPRLAACLLQLVTAGGLLY